MLSQTLLPRTRLYKCPAFPPRLRISSSLHASPAPSSAFSVLSTSLSSASASAPAPAHSPAHPALVSSARRNRALPTSAPQRMSFLARFFSSPPVSAEDMSAAEKKAQQLIDDNAVIVFSKSYCPYCRNSKRTLDNLGAKYAHYELDEESDGSSVQDALEKLTGQRTVPNIFIAKQHIGGNSDLQARKDLSKILADAGAI